MQFIIEIYAIQDFEVLSYNFNLWPSVAEELVL